MPSLPLSQLVDLALGTPEVGAVNFNILHTLLHAIINKLNFANDVVEMNDLDRELLSAVASQYAGRSFSAISKDSGRPDSLTQTEDNLSEKSFSAKSSNYHRLEKEVSDLKKQMEELNKLPSNKQLHEWTLGSKDHERPVSEMWQNMQLKKRVDANEEGLSKLASLIEDLMKEMKQLKDEQKNLNEKFMKINLDEIQKQLNSLDKLLKDLNDKYERITEKLSQVPSLDDFNEYIQQFVTWPGLEDALKGIKKEFENLQPIKEERIVIELGTQTVSRPPSARPVSRASSTLSRVSTSSGPSSELLDLLERLGNLSNLHDQLTKRVEELEKLMALKANKEDLHGLKIPDDLLMSLKTLQQDLMALKEGQIKDKDTIHQILETLKRLQADLEKIQETLEQFVDENVKRAKDVKDLFKYCDDLQTGKADKEYVDVEVNEKADKRHLEGKVNHTLFDSTTSELNRMIKDILDKLNGQEGDWKSALAKAMEELDGKLDRKELNNLRDWLEQQLKALNNKIKTLGAGWQLDDEAAGMKKQLIQHFHCLSCDKPIDTLPHGPVPSIPGSYGLPKSKSPRPYTTFGLDLIRQQARSLAVPPESYDYYATVRQCGGSHTLILPNKRSKFNNMGQLYKEEETITPLHKDEINIQGADGQIYKGRLTAIFPSAAHQQQQPIYMEQKSTSVNQYSAHQRRPYSAGPLSGSHSGRVKVKPSIEGQMLESVIGPANTQVERVGTPDEDKSFENKSIAIPGETRKGSLADTAVSVET